MMDKLHTVMRSIHETKADAAADAAAGAARRDHLTVFRAFLDQLDRASRRKGARVKARSAGKSRRK